MKTVEKQVIEKSEAFVAILMENFVKDPSRYDACKYAENLNKPMYAVIEEGVNWDKFKEIMWRKTFFTPLVTPGLLRMVRGEIKKDLDFLKKAGGT